MGTAAEDQQLVKLITDHFNPTLGSMLRSMFGIKIDVRSECMKELGVELGDSCYVGLYPSERKLKAKQAEVAAAIAARKRRRK